MTEITINAKVECVDGPCGKSIHLIVNPVSRKVTHLVVEDKHLLDEPTRLVPVERVTDATHNLIRLNCTKQDVAGMERFITARYISPTLGQSPIDGYWSELDVYMEPMVIPFTEQPVAVMDVHMPKGEIEIHRGMYVHATDGRIGQVDELMVEPESWRITHLVLRHGHLWGKKEVTLPLSDIDHVTDDEVYLKIDKDTVKSRPTIPVKRLFN